MSLKEEEDKSIRFIRQVCLSLLTIRRQMLSQRPYYMERSDIDIVIVSRRSLFSNDEGKGINLIK